MQERQDLEKLLHEQANQETSKHQQHRDKLKALSVTYKATAGEKHAKKAEEKQLTKKEREVIHIANRDKQTDKSTQNTEHITEDTRARTPNRNKPPSPTTNNKPPS